MEAAILLSYSSIIELVLQDKVLGLLIFAISVIFLSTLILGAYTLFLRYANHLKALKWRRLEDKWQPVLLDVLSGMQQPETLWQLVGDDEGLYFVDFLERFAKRLRGEEREILSELAMPFLETVAKHITADDAEQRARAILTLSLLGLPRYSSQVVAALDDPSPLVAMIAARYLMRREHPEYIRDVLQRLYRFTSWSRNLLASMLASVGSGALLALRDTFADGKMLIWVRVVAADALSQLSDFESADTAADILESETDRELLVASLRLLATIARRDHVPRITHLCDSSDFVVRANALRIIGRLAPDEETERLRTAFDDPSSWVAIQAAQGLREGGNLQLLREIMMSDHAKADLARQVLAEEMQ